MDSLFSKGGQGARGVKWPVNGTDCYVRLECFDFLLYEESEIQ